MTIRRIIIAPLAYNPMQYPRVQLSLLVLGTVVLGICAAGYAAPVFAQEAATTTAAADTAVTTQQLDAENVQSLKIVPIREERVSDDVVLQDAITPNANGEFVLHRQTIVGLEPMAMFGGSVRHDVVQVSGQTQPYAFVTLTMHSAQSVRTEVTRATNSGRWEIRIAVDFLAPGEHITYMQTELNGVQSNELQIARFVVVARDSVSNSTWIFISLIAVAIVLLLVASTLQIHQNGMAMEARIGHPVIPNGRRKK